MGWLDRVLDRTTRPRNTRSWPVGRGEVFSYDKQWGRDDSRFAPDEYQAERYVTANDVYSILASRARLIQDVELRLYRGRGANKKEVENSRAGELLRHVNPYWTAARLARMDEMAMGLWGETFWAIEPPSRMSPTGEIWWLKPNRVKVAPDPDNYIYGYWYESLIGERIFFKADEVVWFRYPNPIEEFNGLSPLIAAKLAADTATAMMKSNRQIFTEGLQIAGLISPMNPDLEYTEEQVDDIEMHLKKRFSGPEKAHRWVVLRKEFKVQPLSMTPKDAEFVQGLNMTFRQVCRAFGMQPTLHGDLEQASPGDTESLERIEWARTLAPDLRLKAQEIEEQLLYRHFANDKNEPDHCEFDFTSIPAMQESESAVWDRESAMMDRGLMTINEWRRRRGWPDVSWGDAPWLPMNKGQWMEEGQSPKGKIVIPGQDPMGGMGGGWDPFGGGFSNTADDGWPQDAQQGGPVFTDARGVPLPVPPDDEWTPINGMERGWNHWDARRFLARFRRGVPLPSPTANGHRR